MSYRIIWSNFATFQLDEIFNYYAKEASIEVAQTIITRIHNKINLLLKNPFVGKKEPLLYDRNQVYRCLIVTNYKVIYSVNEEINVIKITDIFDVRQNPIKLKRN